MTVYSFNHEPTAQKKPPHSLCEMAEIKKKYVPESDFSGTYYS